MSEPEPPRTSPQTSPPDTPAASGASEPDTSPPGRGPNRWAAALADRWDLFMPRWLRLLVGIVAVVVVAGIVADQIELSEYAILPGVAQPVAPLISVPAARAHRIDGRVLLTDVLLSQVTALGFLFDTIEGAQLLPAATVLGPATPPSELAAQGYLEMAQSQAAAKAAALTRLGDDVHARSAGVAVFAVVPGSPAARQLGVGQLITAVDGRATPSACAFSQALAGQRAGSTVRLTVERTHVSPRAVLVPGPTSVERVRLGRWPRTVPRPPATPACPEVATPDRGFLGIEAETQIDYTDPVHITISTTSIGGPSAGLAMTLGIIDALGNGHLTGGRTVAATGTMSANGAVGEVGGVREKTIAVERAGASVFFVPAAQRGTAEAVATSGLRVFGVRSLTQALEDLRHLGGSVPDGRPPGS
jgi:Lon-like protease